MSSVSSQSPLSLLNLCKFCHQFENSLYSNLHFCVRRCFESLSRANKPFTGIFVTGPSSANSYLYDKIFTLQYEAGILPILAKLYPNSAMHAWTALEMLKFGYGGRTVRDENKQIPMLKKMPLGPMTAIATHVVRSKQVTTAAYRK